MYGKPLSHTFATACAEYGTYYLYVYGVLRVVTSKSRA